MDVRALGALALAGVLSIGTGAALATVLESETVVPVIGDNLPPGANDRFVVDPAGSVTVLRSADGEVLSIGSTSVNLGWERVVTQRRGTRVEVEFTSGDLLRRFVAEIVDGDVEATIARNDDETEVAPAVVENTDGIVAAGDQPETSEPDTDEPGDGQPGADEPGDGQPGADEPDADEGDPAGEPVDDEPPAPSPTAAPAPRPTTPSPTPTPAPRPPSAPTDPPPAPPPPAPDPPAPDPPAPDPPAPDPPEPDPPAPDPPEPDPPAPDPPEPDPPAPDPPEPDPPAPDPPEPDPPAPDPPEPDPPATERVTTSSAGGTVTIDVIAGETLSLVSAPPTAGWTAAIESASGPVVCVVFTGPGGTDTVRTGGTISGGSFSAGC